MDPNSLQTINDIFFLAVERKRICVASYKQGTKWISISSHELYRYVVGVSNALREWGIGKGDRVAILSENRPEWAIADFACLAMDVVDVPIYPTLTAEQTAYRLRDAGVRIAFCSTAEQVKKLESIQAETGLEKIIVFDDIAGSSAISAHRLMLSGPTERDRQFDQMARSIHPDDLATIIYTSGTTGTPKGVMLTHRNLASNVAYSLLKFTIGSSDQAISVLPLSHITSRHVDYAHYYHGVPIAYCSNFDQLPQTFLEIKPSFITGVPRMYEKVRQKAETIASRGPKRKLFDWAIRTGRKHLAETATGKIPTALDWKIADALVFSKIRAGFGGRVRIAISGGAPLGRELAEWYASIGMRLYEGYGLTETSPVIAVNSPGDFKIGTVGKPLANVECRIAEDGELLVRGPSVFKGYWNMPTETEAAFTPDAWFKTGDVGSIDADGFLSITDRKKDLIKTSGGKFIAPQPIEGALKTNPLIAEAAIVGDRRKFASVIIAPNFLALEEWAREQDVPFFTRTDLVTSPQVHALYWGIVEQLNSKLAQFEKLKKILVIPDEFSVATGELTPSLKLRRRAVEQKYRDQIEALYAEEHAPERVVMS